MNEDLTYNNLHQQNEKNTRQKKGNKQSRKILKNGIIFVLVFVFGWQSASYYQYKLDTLGEGYQQNSPVDALTSLISAPEKKKDSPANLEIFWKVWSTLADRYIDENSLDTQTMVYGATKGMVAALNDPYTVYMNPDETKEFDQNLNGQLEGIGAELTVRDQSLVVVSALKNSPAEKAGLQPADIIYKIDGDLTSELTLFDAIMKIRGTKGSKVTLTIIRKNSEKPFDVVIERDTVNIESVSMEEKKNGIFYISINQFNETTKPEFEEKVKELLLKEPKGLILDLRNNGGGYLDTSADVLSELIEGKGAAVSVKRRNTNEDETLYLSGSAKLAKIPMVVLINKGSASAAEIVAGALQDYKRAVLMGEQSFGKGSVQEVDKLSDGSSIRFTIARWYTPNGKNIDKVGITPDIKVEIPEDKILKENEDPQLDEAIKYLQKN